MANGAVPRKISPPLTDLYDWLDSLNESLQGGIVAVDSLILGSDHDASSGINRAIDKAVTRAANTNSRAAIALGADSYEYSDPIGLLQKFPIGIIGRGPLISIIRLSPILSGDVFSWSECWFKTGVNADFLAQQKAGVELRDFSVVGARTSVFQQNLFTFYDRNDCVKTTNVECYYIPGRVFACGILNAKTQAYMRESTIRGLKAGWCGLPDVPVIEFNAAGDGDATNSNEVHGLNVWGLYGPGLVLRNSNIIKNLCLMNLFGCRIEGISGGSVANDLLTIGDTVAEGGISDVNFFGLTLISPNTGQMAFKVKAPNPTAAGRIYNIKAKGTVLGPGAGGAIDIQAGRSIEIEVLENSCSGTRLTVGAAAQGIGAPIKVDAGGKEVAWAKSIDATSAALVQTGVRHNMAAMVPPAVTDDQTKLYGPGSIWYIPLSGEVWRCRDGSTGAAIWLPNVGRGVRMRVGRWYNADRFISVGAVVAANSMRFYPEYFPHRITIDTIQVRVNTLFSGGLVQVALFANAASADEPAGNPIASSASISQTNTGNPTAAFAASLEGLMWWATNADNATAILASVGAGDDSFGNMIGASAPGGMGAGADVIGYTSPHTFGTWPDVTGASFAVSTGSSIPMVKYKIDSIP